MSINWISQSAAARKRGKEKKFSSFSFQFLSRWRDKIRSRKEGLPPLLRKTRRSPENWPICYTAAASDFGGRGKSFIFFSSPPGLPHNTQRHRRGGGGLKNSKSYFDRGGGGTTVRRWKNFRRLLQEFWSFVKLHLGASCNK